MKCLCILLIICFLCLIGLTYKKLWEFKTEWCKAQTEATGKEWQYWVLLDCDIEFCGIFSDIVENADTTGLLIE